VGRGSGTPEPLKTDNPKRLRSGFCIGRGGGMRDDEFERAFRSGNGGAVAARRRWRRGGALVPGWGGWRGLGAKVPVLRVGIS